MTVRGRYRILILNNVRSPSFDPLFSRLSGQSDWDLKVCYVSRSADDVGWSSLEGSPRYCMVSLGDYGRLWLIAVARLLAREKPDYVLIYGYSPWAQMAAIFLCTAMRIPFGVIGDANVYCDRATGFARLAKWLWLRFVARVASDIFPVGTAGRLFWERYRVHPGKLHLAPYVVDNDFFARGAAAGAATVSARRSVAVRLIFVGRLIRRKNVALILNALRALPPDSVSLTVAGEGPERAALESLAAAIPQEVRFLGRVEHSALPSRYGDCDALVIAADGEPWALVINEAMASGLAIIAHEHVGAVADLVSDRNGVLLHSFDVAELADAIQLLVSDSARLGAMKEASRHRIEAFSVEAATTAITYWIRATLSKGRSGAMAFGRGES